MIKLTVLYPAAEGATFDHEYYVNEHMPMVQDLLGEQCREAAVERGLAGLEPGTDPAYVAMGHLYFDAVEDFREAFGPNARAILADVPNYTNTTPVAQVSEVLRDA